MKNNSIQITVQADYEAKYYYSFTSKKKAIEHIAETVIADINQIFTDAGAKLLDEQQVRTLIAAQYFGGTKIPVVQLNTPAPRRHGLQRTNRQDIMVERYIYKNCEIEIYQNARSIDTDRPIYFAIPLVPYGKTGKKFTRHGLDDSESVEEAKRSAEVHVDQWEAKQAL
jgi:hypothetical protein